jgi:hypothetical protein
LLSLSSNCLSLSSMPEKRCEFVATSGLEGLEDCEVE